MINENYEDEIDRMKARRKNRIQNSANPVDTDDELELVDIFENDDASETALKTEKKSSVLLSDAVRMELKKRKKKKKLLKKSVIVLLTALLILFAYRHFAGGGYWTVAVFGLDSRDGKLEKGALSDVEMLCSIDRKSGEIRLLSVFRDSYLRVDDDKYNKINEAYFLGGHKQAVNALESNLDIKVDDYATFNWKSVADAINILGGVDLEITDREFAYINSFITETVESTGVASVHLEHSGMNHLDGVQAVAYARLRLMDTDFNRTERQRKVLGLTMEKLKQADAATLTSLVSSIMPQISTSIGADDLLLIAKKPKKYYISETSGFPFSHVEMNIGKKSCVIPATLESNVIQLHAFLYGDELYTAPDSVKKISAKIAEISGVSDPGKDTESGKNVGATGNTGEAQTTAEAPKTEAPKKEAVSETQKAEPETSEAEHTEMVETQETVEALETQESSNAADLSAEVSESVTDVLKPTESEDSREPQKTQESVELHAPEKVQETTNAQEPPKTTESSESQKPHPGTETPIRDSALEAPGQNSSAGVETGGPGAN